MPFAVRTRPRLDTCCGRFAAPGPTLEGRATGGARGRLQFVRRVGLSAARSQQPTARAVALPTRRHSRDNRIEQERQGHCRSPKGNQTYKFIFQNNGCCCTTQCLNVRSCRGFVGVARKRGPGIGSRARGAPSGAAQALGYTSESGSRVSAPNHIAVSTSHSPAAVVARLQACRPVFDGRQIATHNWWTLKFLKSHGVLFLQTQS